MSSIRAPRSVTLVMVLALSCGDDEPGGSKGSVEVPSAAAAAAELQSFAWHEVTFAELLDRYDVDGSGVIDQVDHVALATCIEAGVDLEGSRCDLLADGVIDDQDQYVLEMVVGTVEPNDAPWRTAARDAIAEDAVPGVSLAPLAFDWNGDGAKDQADNERLVEVLEGDLAPFDLDGDGLTSFADVVLFQQQVAAAKVRGGAAPTVDLDGNGVSNGQDVLLFTELVLHTTDTSVGFFDPNWDGRVDVGDFCEVTTGSADTSVYPLFMPAAEAEAAFAAAPPRQGMCRADERAVIRNGIHLDTPMRSSTFPENLFLVPVDSIPPGYDPVDPSLADGRPLFVVRTEVSPFPIEEISLPWDPTAEFGNELRVRVGGELPAGAALVLPIAVVDLDAPVERQREPRLRSARAIDLHSFFPGYDVQAARDLEAGLQAAEDTFAELDAGCPCALDEATRRRLVRYLLRADHDLEATRTASFQQMAVLEELAAIRAAFANEANFEMSRRWRMLHVEIQFVAAMQLHLQLVEVAYDFGTGGLEKAFKGQVSNGINELLSRYDVIPKADSWPGQLGAAAGLDVVTGAATDAAVDAIKKLAETSSELTFREFFDIVKNAGLEKAKVKDPGHVEAIVKALIKAMPGLWLQYHRWRVEAAEARAVAITKEHQDAVFDVGNQRQAIVNLERARGRMLTLRTRFLEKLAAEGCPMTLSTDDPCGFELEGTLATLRDELARIDADAAAALDGIFAGAREHGTVDGCFEGEQARAIERTSAEAAAYAREIIHTARAGGDVRAELNERFAKAEEAASAAESDFQTACRLLVEPDVTADTVTAMATERQKRIDQVNAVWGQSLSALDRYRLCSEGLGESTACEFDPDVAAANPHRQAATTVGCIPGFTMDCCGDGRLQGGEECESEPPALACSGGRLCVECACAPSGTVPDDILDLATHVGLSEDLVLEGWRPLTLSEIIHSAISVPSKPVAHDHTTLDGWFLGRFMLDQDAIDRFSCGEGGAVDRTVCGDAGPLIPGETFAYFAHYEGALPDGDSGNIYQYGFVFDADGDPGNNYEPSPQYANDFFQDSDLWFDMSRTGAGAWTLRATDARDGGFDPVPTRAHAFQLGGGVTVLIPSGEMTVADPGSRATAFRHTGDYGIPAPHDYDGSLHPPVAEGLAPFEP